MRFPALYVFAHIPEAVRRDRMMLREQARGRTAEMAAQKADRYARMVEPQRRYFAALAERFPGWVLDLETVSLERSAANIRGAQGRAVDGLQAFDFIERWLGDQAS
jgi:hypothetical protein